MRAVFYMQKSRQTVNLNLVAKTTNVLESKSPNTFSFLKCGCCKIHPIRLYITDHHLQQYELTVSVSKEYISLVYRKLQSYLKNALYATAWDHFRSRARGEWQHRALLLHFIPCIYLLFFETEICFGWKGNSFLDKQQFLFCIINSCIKMLFTISY